MKCEQIAEILPDHLQGNLNQEQGKQVEEHIAHCADCAEQVAIWKKLALLPAEQPSPAVRGRFEAMLDAYQSGRADRTGVGLRGERRASFWSGLHWLRSPVGALAWSVVLLAAGVYIGSQVKSTDSRGQEIAAMHSELSNMRQLVALSMLQQQSASGRLEGVSWTRHEQQLDPQVLSALMHTLRCDPSVDVRLAALDALTRHASQPQVHKEVADALQEQQSPLVQVALIDQLVEWRDPEAAQRLHKLQQNPKLNPIVRQRAQWAVSKLSPSTN
jgi:anti-sigma-K factor RskA